MKKLTVLFIAIGLIAPIMAQNVVKDDYTSLQVQFTAGDVHIGQTVIDGETFSTVTMDGYSQSVDNYGSPELPIFSRIIEVPLCDGFKVEVSNAVYDTIGPVKHRVIPTQPSRIKSDTSAFKLFMLHDVYSWNAFVGERQAFVEPVGIARDRNLARLQFSPVKYNPASGMLVVCRQATVTISYSNPDIKGTEELFNRYYSPAFHSGANSLNSLYTKSVSTSAPVRYLIVAHSIFRGQMDTFVQWKKRKGFLTDIVYTDDAAVGSTTTSIKAYLQSQYTNATAANPAPTFVLLVGDVQQIPAFNGTVENEHVTDLYYSTWTSTDNIPDCHYGRFSAQNASQLTPQIEKTLLYEQYAFADPSFLDKAVMVAGVDGGRHGDNGYKYGDPAMDYAITNYINGAHGFSNVYYFKNDISRVPANATNVTVNGNKTSANVAAIRDLYSQGAGFINYTAHGSSSGWADPSFTTAHVPNMTNTQKFGIMIGNCCQTNMFGETECFGEALLRRGDYCGAVGYIGGSEVTYWGEDFCWAVGVRSTINANMSMAYNANNLGVYDRSFHTHGEAYSQWITNQSSIIYFGNMSVQASGSSLTSYYWEIYHLMGDPSVMNYLTQASIMTISAPTAIVNGTETLNVTAAPYAYVALTDTATHTVIAAAWADASGLATLQLPTTLPIDMYELTASAPQYRTTFRNIAVINPTDAYVTVSSVIPDTDLVAGNTVILSLAIENVGNYAANNVTVHLASDTPMLTLTTDNLNLGDIAANGQQENNTVSAVVSLDAPDLSVATITATVSWEGCTTPIVNTLPLTIVTPIPVLMASSNNFVIQPGTSTSFTANVRNEGHATLQTSRLTITSPTPLVAVSPASTATATLAHGETLNSLFTITVDSRAPESVVIPLTLQLTSADMSPIDTILPVYTGTESYETFENNFSFSGWTQGDKPWIVDTVAHNGNHSIRSAKNLPDYKGKSETTVNISYTRPDSIAFFYKVSSESGYDKFHFYIDGTEMMAESGEVNWTRASFPVTAGTHSYKFSYEKDWSDNSGSDCVWIDDIKLPRDVHPVSFVYVDTCHRFNDNLPDYTVADDQSVTIYNYRAPYSVRNTVVGCDSCIWNGTPYTASISFLDTLVSTDNCDSIVGVDVIVHPSFTDTIPYVCHSNSYTWNDNEYTTDGEYTQVLATEFGCDSVVTLLLTFDTTGVGIATVDCGQINVYPNPTVNTVHFSRSVDEATLFDLNGRMMVRRNDVQSLDMATLPAGTYVLRLRNGVASATCRIIKK